MSPEPETTADASPPTAAPPTPPSRGASSPEAEFWRARYEEERERLAKLWVAYKDIEAELAKLTTPARSLTPEVPSAPTKPSPAPQAG